MELSITASFLLTFWKFKFHYVQMEQKFPLFPDPALERFKFHYVQMELRF